MPKAAKVMSQIKLDSLKHPGTSRATVLHSVGGEAGLAVQITPNGSKSWLLRTTLAGKRREFGLGSYPQVGLAEARKAARKVKKLISKGKDPAKERRKAAKKAAKAQRKKITLQEACERYIEAELEGQVTEKYRNDWRNSLVNHVYPALGNMPANEVDEDDVYGLLHGLDGAFVAQRVRERLFCVFEWTEEHKHTTGANAARLKGRIKTMLRKAGRAHTVTHQPSLPLKHVPQWFAALRDCDQYGAQAVELIALTALRNGEVTGATWDEIDGDVWIIPAERMKMGIEHRVPLSSQALTLLDGLPRVSELIVPAPRGGVLTGNYTTAVMRALHTDQCLDPQSKRPAVVHGLRGTFRGWCAEQNYPREIAEAALAHQVSNAVERAYQRSDVLELRRAMMQAWAGYLHGTPVRNVVQLHG